MLDLFAPTSGSVLVIGAGALGGRVASAGAANTAGDSALKALWAAVNINAAELIATGLDKKLLLKIKDGPFAPRSVVGAVEDQLPVLANWRAGKSVAFIVGNWSERATTLLVPPLAAALREAKDLFVCAVVCDEPFTGDANRRESAETNDFNCDLFLRVPAQGADLQQEKPLTLLRAETESRLLHVVEALGGALSAATNGSGFGISEIQTALAGGGPLAVSVGSARGADAAVSAAESALKQNSLCGAAGISGMAAAMMMDREPSVAEARTLSTLFQTGSARNHPALFAVSTQPLLENEAFCVVLARGAGSRNVVRMESAI